MHKYFGADCGVVTGQCAGLNTISEVTHVTIYEGCKEQRFVKVEERAEGAPQSLQVKPTAKSWVGGSGHPREEIHDAGTLEALWIAFKSTTSHKEKHPTATEKLAELEVLRRPDTEDA